jgi:RNA polymerase sigma-70 factor (sigma-E family)
VDDAQIGRPVLSVEAMVTAHYGELQKRAYLLCDSADEAEDLLQEALARYLLASRRRNIDNVEAYTIQTMLNLRTSLWRRQVAQRAGRFLIQPVSSVEEDFVNRDALWTIITAIPPKQRAVLVLRYYEDRTESDIADLLGISIGTVRSQHAKAIAKLRRAMKEGRLEA